MPTALPVSEPFPIYASNGRYLLFDVNVVSHVRKVHHMCGCLSGTLPQIPQQNVFLGLPLELMMEEAALLVEKGVAYVVDDQEAHRRGLKAMLEEDKRRFLKERQEEALQEALGHQRMVDERKEQFSKKRLAKGKGKAAKPKETTATETEDSETAPTNEPATPAEDSETSGAEAVATPAEDTSKENSVGLDEDEQDGGVSLFELSGETPCEPQTTPASVALTPQSLLFFATTTTSSPPYHLPTPSTIVLRPNPSSYPLYKHLHAAGYFLSPGLRFGCQFMAYPGDPLRFHSHFITRGLGWDEEVDLIDIVGGGRLGTGVKKAWMFGGAPEAKDGEEAETRVFCVEWGGF